MKEATRLQNIKEYYFSTKLKEIAQLNKEGKKIINLGIGNPDLMPPKSVLKTLKKEINKKNHGYQSYRGIAELRQAISQFYKKKYQVSIHSDNEVLPLIGSKEGIMHISMAFLNPNDEVLIPETGYLTYTSATLLAGGKPIYYPLTEKHNYLPDLVELEKINLSKVKIMWLNYPHMPTGAIAQKKHFKKMIKFAKKNNILLVNDNPYSFILNDNPSSILQIKNAKKVAMELNSLSKSHNMAGWRIGMLLGSKNHINTVIKFKSQMDSGMFYALQKSAVSALKVNKKWYKKINKIYSRRKKIVLKICNELNLKVSENQAGLFVWAKLPKNTNSKDFSDNLLYQKSIFITPGFIFGNSGNNYVRISLTSSEKVLKKVLKILKNK